MSLDDLSVNRRDFVRNAAAVGAALGAAKNLLPKSTAKASGRVIGANDRINVAVIGGSRGAADARTVVRVAQTSNAQVLAVCDLYEKRKKALVNQHKCDGYTDYREVLNRADVDAVVIAVPDHWHARMALEAMDLGKDVYVEKPMTHTIPEAKQLVAKVKETKRVLQVGSQTTSGSQWAAAKQAIAEGSIGHMVMSQGSYHRNSANGEWNYTIDPNAGPDGKGDDRINWSMWISPAAKRSWDADRFFRFRKYWDYSGGIATDLFFHVVSPMNICWPAPEFPTKVMAGGVMYGGPAFEEKREVPDTFHFIADFPSKHSLVLSSSMANSHHIPGLIRGHLGTIVMVDNGEFESATDHITLTPENRVTDAAYKAKFGTVAKAIPVKVIDDEAVHMANFLDCMRTRQKPTLDVETGYHVQVTISMAVQSYREGRVLYWDAKNEKVVPNNPAKT